MSEIWVVYSMKLASKVLWIVVVVITIPTTALTGLFTYREWVSSSQRELEANRVLIAAVYPLLLSSYWNFDRDTIGLSMVALLESKSIRSISLYDEDGHVFKAAQQDSLNKDETLPSELWSAFPEFFPTAVLQQAKLDDYSERTPYLKKNGPVSYRILVPLKYYDSERVLYRIKGILVADYSLWELEQRLLTIIAVSILLGILFVALLVSVMHYLLQRSVVQPVASLALASKHIADGDFETPVEIESEDEIGILALNFEDMRLKMKNYTEILREKNEALEETLNDLQHEVTSRVAMVGDLAHRGNNPIHAGNLAIENLAHEFKHLEELVLELFSPFDALDDDGKLCFQTMKTIMSATQNQLEVVCNTRGLIQLAIQDIRVLGGVDGTNVEAFPLEEVLAHVKWRLAHSTTQDESTRIYWVWKDGTQCQLEILANKQLMAICLERLFRQILLETDALMRCEVQGIDELRTEYVFSFSFPVLEEHSVQRLKELCGNLTYIMKGFGTRFFWSESGLEVRSLKADLSSLSQDLA